MYEKFLKVRGIEEATQLQSPTAMFFQLSRGFMASPVQIFLDITTPYAFKNSIEALERTSRILAVAPEEILGPSLSSILETLAQKEVEYVLLRSSFSPDVPEVNRVGKEVEVLRRKIEKKFQEIPPAIRKAVRYRTELEIKSRVYATLYEEYEKARLMELKNNPMLQAVSSPSGPIKRVWPKRVVPAITMVVGLSFALVFLLALFAAVDRIRETTLGRILLSIRRDLAP